MNERNFTDKIVAMLGMWLVVSFDNCYIKLANISLAITLFLGTRLTLYHYIMRILEELLLLICCT